MFNIIINEQQHNRIQRKNMCKLNLTIEYFHSFMLNFSIYFDNFETDNKFSKHKFSSEYFNFKWMYENVCTLFVFYLQYNESR